MGRLRKHIQCKICGNSTKPIFDKRTNRVKGYTKTCCSKECIFKIKSITHTGNQHCKGKTNSKGHIQSEENRKKTGERFKGKQQHMVGNTNWLGKRHKIESIEKMRKSHKRTVDLGLSHFIGVTNPAWVDGKSGERRTKSEKERITPEYKFWRRQVFCRDNYTCQKCGDRGGNLQADHIKPLATNPELMLDLTNGRTLCVKCHKETDTYGNGAIKMKQIQNILMTKGYLVN